MRNCLLLLLGCLLLGLMVWWIVFVVRFVHINGRFVIWLWSLFACGLLFMSFIRLFRGLLDCFVIFGVAWFVYAGMGCLCCFLGLIVLLLNEFVVLLYLWKCGCYVLGLFVCGNCLWVLLLFSRFIVVVQLTCITYWWFAWLLWLLVVD